jgi:hypothetical protein
MKYKVLRTRDEPVAIYILPVSSDSDEYRIIYPDRLEKNPLKILERGGIRIYEFEGCSKLAVSEVREYLVKKLDQSAIDYSRTTNTLIGSGIAVGLFGIVDWLLPDPLPVVDETFFIVTGTIMVFLGFRQRRQTDQYRDRVAWAKMNLQGLKASDQSVLTRLFKSIRTKEKPETEDDSQPPFPDRIDLESQWLVRYIDVHEMIESGKATDVQVKEVIASLCDIIPLRALVKMEKRSDRVAVRRRLKTLKEKIAEELGITDSALSVYCEFFKSAQNYFESKGRRI